MSQGFRCPTLSRQAAIASAAEELNDFRKRWLNPTEWTVERILEFPGSIDGPWTRYLVNPDKNGIGTVRYPRFEPSCCRCLSIRLAVEMKDEEV
jgi:hypothetical protein